MANRLAQETSPYLLQHQDNPVDWYPWGPEALERARREDRPILLSIGYSACHWCHVMAHESFENDEIARVMNERFVNIKVDREERPDLDHIYQNVAQAMTRSGGWPLTVFLTPDLKPYFGGTYFPPEDRYGRPGFPRALVALSEAYQKDRHNVVENARRLTEFIAGMEKVGSGGERRMPSREGLLRCAESLQSNLDFENGGFGSAPKFPNPMLLSALWRLGEPFREGVLLTLRKMAAGGIYDQLGGGFSRYSVDETWSVPHFEKMLYDNGLLLGLYSEVLLSPVELQAGDRALFTRVVAETVRFLLREMRSPEGLFFAALDADSEGEEGRYYVWDPEEVGACLEPREADAFLARYGVSTSGNFEHGKTVLHLAADLVDAAMLGLARNKLFMARAKRVRPGTDTKCLASWNGLVISGLIWAARALEDPAQAQALDQARVIRAELFSGDATGSLAELAVGARRAAEEAFQGVEQNLVRSPGRLWSTLQMGRPRHNAYLDDYAFLARAALDLARFEKDAARLNALTECAKEWLRTIQRSFRDASEAGYFFTADDHEQLIQRPKTLYDQAIPAGTAVAIGCMIALSEIEAGEWDPEWQGQLGALFPQVMGNPKGYGELLSAAWLSVEGPVVLSGPGAGEAIRNPRVFQKKPELEAEGKRLLCHGRTCSAPLENFRVGLKGLGL